MWFNMMNMLYSDLDDFIEDNSKRETCNILCKPKFVTLYQASYRKTDVWIVRVETEANMDPKVHFTDKAKAEALYSHLCALLVANATNDNYVEINVLEHGAL